MNKFSLTIIFVLSIIINIYAVEEISQNNLHTSPLFTSFDNALPTYLYNKLMPECLKIEKWAVEQESFMHGKRTTFFFNTDSNQKPRGPIEEAIVYLKKYVNYRKDISTDPNANIIGAEWWIQIRSGKESISFHYDKDEALASIKGIMKHPLVSTITYLTDIGAPTLILNQTTPDGNHEIPLIPNQGMLSYPKVNRHTIFRGDLQHGVVGSAATKISSKSSEKRVTLLINWWHDMPAVPNTIEITDGMAKSFGWSVNTLISSNMNINSNINFDNHNVKSLNLNNINNKDISSIDGTGNSKSIFNKQNENEYFFDPRSHSTQSFEVLMHKLDIPDSNHVRHQIEFPPGDMHFFNLPVNVKNAVYYIEWKDNQCYGHIGMLNLFKQNQVDQLFRLPEPKMMLLYNPEDKKMYNEFLNSILPFSKNNIGNFKFYFCPFDVCSDAARAFGLTSNDLPRLVADFTSKENPKKVIQNKEHFGTSINSIEMFWNSTFNY